MSLEVFNGTSIPRELATAAMEFLWAKWKTLNATNSLTLQRLTEECSYPLRDNSSYMVSAGDDFVFMYIGKNIQAAARRNLTGTMVSDNDNPLSAHFLEIYRQCARRFAPVFVRYTGLRSADGQIWQRLILPIRVGSDTTIIVVYSELISYQNEVYEHLFRTAPDAILIACPIVNDVGHAVDGWVTMMNDRARELLNYEGSLGNLRLASLPQFAGVDIWGRLYAPKAASAATPIRTAEFDVELLRFPNVLACASAPNWSRA